MFQKLKRKCNFWTISNTDISMFLKLHNSWISIYLKQSLERSHERYANETLLH